MTLVKPVIASLKINEIYPAPPSGEFEWVEFYNNEDQSIDLTNYTVSDLVGNKLKLNTNLLSPFGYAIATSSSVLNNTGDTVFLKDVLNQTIEIATYSGSFDSEHSYVRCPDGSGSFFKIIFPSKNFSNESACILLTPTPTLIPTAAPTPTLSSSSYSSIFISEVMVNPETGETEWIELFNDNNFEVSLADWYIDDIENGGSSAKIFSLTIDAKGYAIIELNSSIFNNDGDSVRLLDTSNALKDNFDYEESEKGKSLGRLSFDSNEYCIQETTKGTINGGCIIIILTTKPSNPTPTKKITPTKRTTPTKSARITKASNTRTSSTPRSNNSKLTNIKNSQTDGQILGAESEIRLNRKSQKSLSRSLSFASFSYSILTIISIFTRMKIG